MFGAGRGCTDIVYMTHQHRHRWRRHTINGKILVRGKRNGRRTGPYDDWSWHGERYKCGNIGCLEYIASGTSVARRANEAIRSGEGIELLAFARTMLKHIAVQ